jgi:hypothetical protein
MNHIGPEQLIIPILADIYNWGKSKIQAMKKPGMYEVLDYESTLEILDPRGMVAKFQKKERVRFLQHNVIAVQDQLWGFKKNIYDYKCSPGIPADFYESGHKTLVVISMREIYSKKDEVDLNMQWYLKGDPIGKSGSWETYINQYTHKLCLNVVFPAERPPVRIWLSEGNKKRISELGRESLSHLPDKQWQITWEKNNPAMYETYTMKWEW